MRGPWRAVADPGSLTWKVEEYRDGRWERLAVCEVDADADFVAAGLNLAVYDTECPELPEAA